MRRNSTLLAAVAGLFAAAVTATPSWAADEGGGIKAGVLTCNVDSGWGFIFGSSRDLKCSYSHGPHSLEQYVGQIKKFGVDIGYVSGGVMAWTVIAPTVDVGKGSLAGDYVGATGSAAVGVGAGANVLVGGFQHSFTLQPLSLEGSTGLNVAGGIAQLTLEYKLSVN